LPWALRHLRRVAMPAASRIRRGRRVRGPELPPPEDGATRSNPECVSSTTPLRVGGAQRLRRSRERPTACIPLERLHRPPADGLARPVGALWIATRLGLGRALASRERRQLLHQRLEAGWRECARVVTGEDGPHAVLDDAVPPRMSQDVEAIVADGGQHLIADPAWIEALLQLLHGPLPAGVRDRSGHALRGL